VDASSPSQPATPFNPALGWVGLGLSALLLSSCFGLFLVLSRAPLFSPWLATTTTQFSRALVYHVDFAVLIWFLSMTGALITHFGHSSRHLLNRAALALTWSGTVIMLGAGMDDHGQAVLSNYVPVLNSPFFIAGLSVLWLAACLLALHGVFTLWAPWNMLRQAPIRVGLLTGSLAWLAAMVAFFLVVRRLGWTFDAISDFNTLFWAGGHILQWAHVLLLLALWLFLLRPFQPDVGSLVLASGFVIALLPAFVGVVLVLALEIPSAEYHQWFTDLMKYASWWAVPGTLMAVWPCRRMLKQPLHENDPVTVSVFLSIILLVQGIFFGILINGDTVLVTAHYHAAVGAVTLGYMGLVRYLLTGSRVVIGNPLWARWQPWIFGSGVFLLTSGLELSGIHGVERKVPGLTSSSVEEMLGMALAGAGGSLAMVGVVVFSFFPLKALGRQWMARSATASFSMRHRGFLLFATVMAIGVVSQMLEQIPSSNPRADHSGAAAVVPSTEDELKQRFLNGALLLQSKRYSDAVAVFHVILQEHPRLPEAHVNMGYALLGLGKMRAALDFFQGALALNPYQTNAYFGLAVALESEGDLETALGAMRSFVHMSPDTDPWLPRARSAIWEWEAELAKRRTN